MTVQVPTLTARDLEDELRRIHAKDHRTLNTAFYGVAAADVDTVDAVLSSERTVRFRVAQASCELEARKVLASVTDPLVLLVSFDERLPFDVTGRLAGGKVRFVSDERRLGRLFGAKTVSAELLASPLRPALLAESGLAFGALSGATLDLETAWRRYLERKVRLPVDAPFSEERLVAHCALTKDVDGFAAGLSEQPELRTALHKHIKDRAGDVAELAWRAWERGRGVEVAAFAFVLQAAWPRIASSEYLQAWLALRLADLDPDLKNAVADRAVLLERWGGLADRLSIQFTEAQLEAVLAVGDRLTADDDKLRAALGPSSYLSSALTEGKARLAAALEDAAVAPDSRTTGRVRSLLDALKSHRLQAREPHKSQLDRARMAARLVAYLATQRSSPRSSAAQLPGDVVAELALEYVREGGFVDRARAAARGPRVDALDQAIANVVDRVDRVRDEMDERFATALPAWWGNRKTDRVVPVDQALDKFCVAFLDGHEHRSLLVLLMDGMSWATAVELLLDLEDQRWGAVRWQPKGASGDLLPPMLAAVPTLTGVSRSSLFAGKLVKPGEAMNTSLDPERFDGHKGLRKLLGYGPTLLLKPEAEDRPGHASKKALDLVASESRVVGIVVNAIDDQLKAGAGLEVTYRMQTLKALPDLLAAAAVARRAVLMVADHGHVLGARFAKALPGTERQSARSRELLPGEEPANGEVVFDQEGGWRSKPGRRLAMLYRETDSYGVGSHRGEHGGASLAEVIAPAILIASDELSRSVGVNDPELDLRAFPRPTWWDLEVVEHVTDLPAVPSRKDKPVKPTNQLSIPIVTPVPASAPQEGRHAQLLRASDFYKKADKADRQVWDTRVLPVVELLEEHRGSMPDDTFAARMGVPKFRVPGVVAGAAEKLNLEQHAVLVHDRGPGLVRIDLVLLEQLFGGPG